VVRGIAIHRSPFVEPNSSGAALRQPSTLEPYALGKVPIVVPPQAPALAPLVRSVSIVEDVLPSRRERMVPTGGTNLLINLDADEFRTYDGLGNGRVRRVRGAVLAGPRDRPTVIDTEEQRWLLIVDFLPGGALPFLVAPPWETSNQWVELHDLWGADGGVLRERLLGVGSEIWSATSGPIEEAAALAFSEPPEIAERIRQSRALHATVCRAVAARFAEAGVTVPAPRAAFYAYPDFAPWREHLARRHGVTTGAGLARHLLDRYGMGVLPGSAFGEPAAALRLRVATGLLYGDTGEQREHALAASDPIALPWIAAALARLEAILAGLGPR